MLSDSAGYGPLGPLALSRATVSRAAQRRDDTAWVERAWTDPRSRVIVVDQGRCLARDAGDGCELLLVPPSRAPEGTRFLLGVDDDGIAYFGVSGEIGGAGGQPRLAPGEAGRPPVPGAGPRDSQDGYRPVALRQVGAVLSDRDAGLLTHAVAMANWHDSHTHCPRCGAPTVPAPAGHLRTCPACGTDHFPRLDPAIITLVTDPEGRCLLARNVTWPPGRMSVIAGFVEPGESAEHAVAREVLEETSIRVGQIRYLGSQPWPMPRSLMLGFGCAAPGGQQIIADGEEIAEARWFTRDEMRAAIDGGDLTIAPASSIARRLIEYWYGGGLPDSAASWPSPAR